MACSDAALSSVSYQSWIVYYADEGLLKFLFSACPLVCISVRGSYHPAVKQISTWCQAMWRRLLTNIFTEYALSLRLPASHIVILVTKVVSGKINK